MADLDEQYDGSYDDELDPDLYDELGNPYPECGWDSRGGCDFAGSEQCDFECPNRNLLKQGHKWNSKRKVPQRGN